MDRRRFLVVMSAGAAGIALEQAIPFGQVWSFPKNIAISKPMPMPHPTWDMSADFHFAGNIKEGDIVSIAGIPGIFQIGPIYPSGGCILQRA